MEVVSHDGTELPGLFDPGRRPCSRGERYVHLHRGTELPRVLRRRRGPLRMGPSARQRAGAGKGIQVPRLRPQCPVV